jgi:hypothetical protein
LLPHFEPVAVPAESIAQMHRLGDSVHAQLAHWHVEMGVCGYPAAAQQTGSGIVFGGQVGARPASFVSTTQVQSPVEGSQWMLGRAASASLASFAAVASTLDVASAVATPASAAPSLSDDEEPEQPRSEAKARIPAETRFIRSLSPCAIPAAREAQDERGRERPSDDVCAPLEG